MFFENFILYNQTDAAPILESGFNTYLMINSEKEVVLYQAGEEIYMEKFNLKDVKELDELFIKIVNEIPNYTKHQIIGDISRSSFSQAETLLNFLEVEVSKILIHPSHYKDIRINGINDGNIFVHKEFPKNIAIFLPKKEYVGCSELYHKYDRLSYKSIKDGYSMFVNLDWIVTLDIKENKK